ncbi:MAG TPA: helix-turn-helix transcriptional regulator [Candidatus Acidoferrum sp.]|nr:helix-turn-helix transcriptional regulator [Candidatus Acidoferrum sp.]
MQGSIKNTVLAPGLTAAEYLKRSKLIFGLLAQPIRLKILASLALEPRLKLEKLTDVVKGNVSNVSFHTTKLRDGCLVEPLSGGWGLYQMGPEIVAAAFSHVFGKLSVNPEDIPLMDSVKRIEALAFYYRGLRSGTAVAVANLLAQTTGGIGQTLLAAQTGVTQGTLAQCLRWQNRAGVIATAKVPGWSEGDRICYTVIDPRPILVETLRLLGVGDTQIKQMWCEQE